MIAILRMTWESTPPEWYVGKLLAVSHYNDFIWECSVYGYHESELSFVPVDSWLVNYAEALIEIEYRGNKEDDIN